MSGIRSSETVGALGRVITKSHFQRYKLKIPISKTQNPNFKQHKKAEIPNPKLPYTPL